jgi:hypothetical protein
MRVRKNWLAARQGWHRVVAGIGFVGVVALAFCWSRTSSLPQATAQAPAAPRSMAAALPNVPEPSPDYSRRVVAYIYGNVPITREELGEYLIARLGAEKLELLVNKRIIDRACQEKGIEVTAAEVEAALAEDLKGINIDRAGFVNKVLKQYGKTLYEWKEDVIRPRLLLTKLCRDRVSISEQDLREAFEARYGEKVDCRIIMWPPGQEQLARKAYGDIRTSEEEFERMARSQANPNLAATGGQIMPISRYSGNPEVEQEAFRLKPGELSRVIGTPEGAVVLKCNKRVPPDTSKSLEHERASLEKEVFDKKIQQEIPKVFNELRNQAKPNLILRQYDREDDLLRDVQKELGIAAPPSGTPAQTPARGQ